MGSIPKFTALSGHADLDVLVVLHCSRHIKEKSPAGLLSQVRKPLGPEPTRSAATASGNSAPKIEHQALIAS